MSLTVTSTPLTKLGVQRKKFDKLARGMTGKEFFEVFEDDIVWVNGSASEVSTRGDVAAITGLDRDDVPVLTFYLDISPPARMVPHYTFFTIDAGNDDVDETVDQETRIAIQITGRGSLHDELDNITTPIINDLPGNHVSTTLGHVIFGASAERTASSGNYTMTTSFFQENSNGGTTGGGGANLGRTFRLSAHQRLTYKDPFSVNRHIMMHSESSFQGNADGDTQSNNQSAHFFLGSQDDANKQVYRAIFELERNLNTTLGNNSVSFEIYYVCIAAAHIPEFDFEQSLDT